MLQSTLTMGTIGITGARGTAGLGTTGTRGMQRPRRLGRMDWTHGTGGLIRMRINWTTGTAGEGGMKLLRREDGSEVCLALTRDRYGECKTRIIG